MSSTGVETAFTVSYDAGVCRDHLWAKLAYQPTGRRDDGWVMFCQHCLAKRLLRTDVPIEVK